MNGAADSRPQAATLVLSKLAYEHGVRGLDSQAAVIDEIHGRGQSLLVGAVSVATLFSGLLFSAADPSRFVGLLALMPLALLLCSVVSVVGVLRPTGKKGAEGELQLVAGAAAILDLEAQSESEAYAEAATALEEMWDSNQVVIERSMTRLRTGFLCLGWQVASWVVLFSINGILK